MTTVGRLLSGRYQLEQLLGTGGMGTVWQARDMRLDRTVAIKELNTAGLTLPMAIERFDREARAVARLAHPNIVALHDIGTEDGRPYLVMELVHGRSVSAMLEEGPVSPAVAVAIAAQTCDGLATAHEAGVVHRDVKPANLLVTSAGVVKICDFGLARLHDASGDITLSGVTPLLGSYKFLAPEQVAGAQADARTDLYALGCTLYAMLTGAPPFSGDPQVVLQQHLTQPPPPLTTMPSPIPAALEELVRQLLSKEPGRRPASAAEVKQRLIAVGQDPAIGDVAVFRAPLSAVPDTAVPGPPPAPGLAHSPVHRRIRAIAGAASALVAVVLATLGVAAWLRPGHDVGADASPPAPAAASPSAAVTGQPAASAPTATAEPQPTVVPKPTLAATDAGAPLASPRPGSSPTPTDPIVAMRISIRRQVDAGFLSPGRAPDLYKTLDDIAQTAQHGKPADTDKKVKGFRDKLTELRSTGTLTSAGYDNLNGALDQLATSLAVTEPTPPPKPTHR